jgi:hypothetical protein
MFERDRIGHKLWGCRKHVIACPELMLKAVSCQDGVSSLKLVVRYLAMR